MKTTQMCSLVLLAFVCVGNINSPINHLFGLGNINILLISVPPKISHVKHDYVVIVGNPVQLPCEAQGIPPPTISWHRGRQELASGHDPGMVFLPNGALRISRVSTSHGGVYTCVASSIAGNDTKLISLIVQGTVLMSTDIISELYFM